MAAPKHEFGDTCPLLNVARKHGVPYEVPLSVADARLHGRWESMSRYGWIVPNDLLHDIDAVCDRMRNLQSGTEVFP